MTVYNVTDERFSKYGKIIKNIDFTSLVSAMKDTPIPDDVIYQASTECLERLEVTGKIRDIFFGELPVQVGYCNGHNVMLDALEYHRSSEINVAATDTILLLGLVTDITRDLTYDTSNVEAFLIPAGTAVEIYATTLHYAPCHVNKEGFQVAVILPEGTNTELEAEHVKISDSDEDSLLAAKNKWLIGHPEAKLPEGTHNGLLGGRIDISKID